MSSRQDSYQASQDSQLRPLSRDSMRSGAGGFPSSISYGVLDDTDIRGRSGSVESRHQSHEYIHPPSGMPITTVS